MSSPRILSVGQCGLDGPRIKSHLQSAFDAEVREADSVADATEQMEKESFDLVLVNRILDATGEKGQNVVTAAVEHGTKVMLVSNYDDAQQTAVEAGAEPGFGKAALGDPAADEKIRAALS